MCWRTSSGPGSMALRLALLAFCASLRSLSFSLSLSLRRPVVLTAEIRRSIT